MTNCYRTLAYRPHLSASWISYNSSSCLTSLWGSPPLFWSHQCSTLSSCPWERCLTLTAQGHEGRHRHVDDSGSWPSPDYDRKRQEKTEMWIFRMHGTRGVPSLKYGSLSNMWRLLLFCSLQSREKKKATLFHSNINSYVIINTNVNHV